MLFKPELCELILAGRKTQTRRLVEEGDKYHGTWVERQGRMKWRMGDTYAIQPGRGKPAVGRIMLLRISMQPLRDISVEEAEAEGCEYGQRCDGTVVYPDEAFAELWDAIHGKPGTRWDDSPHVWVLTFKLAIYEARPLVACWTGGSTMGR